MKQETVTIVGAGVIGCSYASWFAAKGYLVRIFDVRDGYESSVLERIRTDVSDMPSVKVDEAMGRISCFRTLEEACEGADFVQENGPEMVDFKQSMFMDLEKICGSETLLVSSSSGITPEVIGAKMKSPERAMIGHPFNPPHVLPIVEVCLAQNVPEELAERVMDFYERSGRTPVRLNKPIDGFILDRLQYVLVREAVSLIEEGIVDVPGLDKALMESLGVRWAAIGAVLAGQLGGGAGGIRGILEKIFPRLAGEMGLEPFSTKALDMLEEQCHRYYPMERIGEFAKARDARQRAILEVQKKYPLPKIEG